MTDHGFSPSLHWLFGFQVSGIASGASQEPLKQVLVTAGVPVDHITLDSSLPDGKLVAYVRLPAPKLPWQLSAGDLHSQQHTKSNSEVRSSMTIGISMCFL